MRKLIYLLLINMFLLSSVVHGESERRKMHEAEAHFEKGVNYLKTSKPENIQNAIKEFNEALQLYPQFSGAYFFLGGIYLNTDPDQAILEFNKAIETNSQNADAYLGLGEAYQSKGNTQEALKAYDASIKVNPNSGKPHLEKSHLFYQNKKLDEAIYEANKAIMIDPDFSEAYLFRGLVYASLKKYDTALSDLLKAKSLGGVDVDQKTIDMLKSKIAEQQRNK